jgi:hypothetical protein
MRCYAIEIKGIARPGMLKDNLPGRLCLGKLQPRQAGSILGNLLNEALFDRNLLFKLATSARPQTRYYQLHGLRPVHYEGA